MQDIFSKFLNLYFLHWKQFNNPENDLVIDDKNNIHNKIMYIYLFFFVVSMIAIWFSVDSANWIIKAWVFIIILILSLIIASIYAYYFFLKNNKIKYFRGGIYILIFFLLIPGICFYNFSSIVPQLLAYYYFYNLFLVLYFFLIWKIYYFFTNFIYCINVWFGIGLLFFKGFFIKLDTHNIKNIVEKLKIPRKISFKDVQTYNQKLKNKFRVYWGILTIYAFINLLFWTSMYWIYTLFIQPFNEKTLKTIQIITQGSHWLNMLFKVAYGSIFMWIVIFCIFLLLNTFFLYLEIHFFDLVEEKLKKSDKK